MVADQVRISVRGKIVPGEIVMEVEQGSETNEVRIPVQEPPHLGTSLEAAINRQELVVGLEFTTPYFDPVTLSQGEMLLVVDGIEVLEGGEEAYWISTRFSDIEARILALPTGETLRQEGMLGMSVVRMEPEEARALPNTDEVVDIIALSAVPVTGRIIHPRSLMSLQLKIGGVDPERVVHQPPLQTVDGDLVDVQVPLLEEIPALPVSDRTDPQWLEATPLLPVHHPDIRERSEQVVAGARTRLQAVQALVDHVFEYVEKVPTIGVPNGLEVLHSARGDCNEHTALFTSLARAAGIPTRIAAGVVYTSRLGDRGAFYYHAWPEVRLGGPTGWIPVDPTFGQVPADATHVKLVEGDLKRQVEIMGVMGKLRFAVPPRE
jgi:hypothetical protein